MKAGPLEIAAPSASLRAIEAIDVVVRSMISRDYAACAVKNIGAAHRLKNFSLEEWCEDVWRSEGLFWGIGPHSVYVRWASASPSGETWALAYDVPGGYRVLSSDPVPDQCRLSRCRKHCLGGFWEALSRYICHDIGQDTVRSLRLDLW